MNLCRRCGRPRARIRDAGGWLHFRCLSPSEQRSRRIGKVLPLLEGKAR